MRKASRAPGGKSGWRILSGIFLPGAVCMFLLGAVSAGGDGFAEDRGGASPWEGEAEREEEAFRAGTIRMEGSTSMGRLAGALGEGFMEKYPGVTVTVEFTGTGAGIGAVISGDTDIGNSSRALTDREKEGGAVENVVALDGILLCVDSSNTVRNLTVRQLADIYAGRLTNWSQAGGRDCPVVTVGREAGSGTRSDFEAFLGLRESCDYANEMDSSGAVLAKVAATPGAIGYVSLETKGEGVIVLSLEDVEPTAENIRDGTYPLSRTLIMVTRGEISDQNTLIRTWFDYVLGREGQEIVSKVGLVRVD